jgi:hypothetical protein
MTERVTDDETRITESTVTMVEVEITDPLGQTEGFEPWVDRIRAVWYPAHDRPTEAGGWWELSGENCGAGNGMILHPYQVGPLIELLQALPVAASSAPVGLTEGKTE